MTPDAIHAQQIECSDRCTVCLLNGGQDGCPVIAFVKKSSNAILAKRDAEIYAWKARAQASEALVVRYVESPLRDRLAFKLNRFLNWLDDLLAHPS